MNMKRIICNAMTHECWSANGKYNYGPIDAMKYDIFINGYSGYRHSLYRKNVHMVTDRRTYFAYLLMSFDVYVYFSYLVQEMKESFPETTEEELRQWLKEDMGSHQVLFG